MHLPRAKLILWRIQARRDRDCRCSLEMENLPHAGLRGPCPEDCPINCFQLSRTEQYASLAVNCFDASWAMEIPDSPQYDWPRS